MHTNAPSHTHTYTDVDGGDTVALNVADVFEAKCKLKHSDEMHKHPLSTYTAQCQM